MSEEASKLPKDIAAEEGKVNVQINGTWHRFPRGTRIADACRSVGVPIPCFCYHPKLAVVGSCRMCMVEVEDTERLVPACNTQVVDGMVIRTNSPRVRQARKTNLRLILSQHDSNCTVCVRSGNCELQKLSHDLNIHYQPYQV